MKIRLHEIELGSSNVQEASTFFQSVFGLKPLVQQDGLTVFDPGTNGLDLNISSHFPKGIVALSFLTDDLEEMENRLKAAGISFDGPASSHLGMRCIMFNSPDGYIIKVNTPEQDSPEWLKA